MSNLLIERISSILDRMTKKSLHENYKNNPILSQNGDNFLSHLMSDIVGMNEAKRILNEVTVVDMKNRPKYKATEIPNILSHAAVTQKTGEHAEHYRKLMQNGEKIAQEVPNKSHKRLKSEFNSYMDDFENHPEKRRSLVRNARTHMTQYRQERQGYTGGKANVLGGNTKIAKNESQAENSTGLSLSPFSTHGIRGHSNCVKSTSGCQNSCLAYTTGQNAMLSNINSKIATTQYLVHHPKNFAAILHHNMLKHIDETENLNNADWHQKQVQSASESLTEARKNRKNDTTDLERKLTEAKTAQKEHANGKRYTAGFRLNVTSDYNIPDIMGRMLDHVHNYAKSKGVDMIARDYTKHAERLYEKRPKYHFLALSHTGQNRNNEGKTHEESNDVDVSKALEHGHTVAGIVHGDATHVYDHKTKRFYPIVDGDDEDMIEKRHEQAGHITHEDGTGSDLKTGKKPAYILLLELKDCQTQLKMPQAALVIKQQIWSIHRPNRT